MIQTYGVRGKTFFAVSHDIMMRHVGTSPKLEAAARTAVRDVLAVQRKEKVLIVGNPGPTFPIVSALYRQVELVGGKPRLMIQPVKTPADFMEPQIVAALEEEPPVVIYILEDKVGRDLKRVENPIRVGNRAYTSFLEYLIHERKTRSFFSPRIKRPIFEDLAPIDYPELRRKAALLKDLFDRAERIHISTKAGTKVTIETRGRKALLDNGDLSKPGSAGNFPYGEVYMCPARESVFGTIVFDGTIPIPFSNVPLILRQPIKAIVKNGWIDRIGGGEEARKLREAIERVRKQYEERELRPLLDAGKITQTDMMRMSRSAAWNIGEFGIGLNPLAKVSGESTIADEKAFGTCHFAIGWDYFGESSTINMHLDGIVRNPTVTFFFPDGTQKTVRFVGSELIID